MPIEIRELQIKVTVGDEGQAAEGTAAPSSGEAQEDIIKACVEQVLAILEKQRER